MAGINPELVFDESKAEPRFPIPVIKSAVLVPIHEQFPSFIQPEWDEDGTDPQVFIGSYYLVLDGDGRGRYGSAYEQWRNMHQQVPAAPGQPAINWVKVEIPMGYHVDEITDIVTLMPDPEQEEGFQEARKTIAAGTLVLRQPGGELQHVRPADEPLTYFTPEKAAGLGLPELTLSQFAIWAIEHATSADEIVSRFQLA